MYGKIVFQMFPQSIKPHWLDNWDINKDIGCSHINPLNLNGNLYSIALALIKVT